jgi:hypothetical protein
MERDKQATIKFSIINFCGQKLEVVGRIQRWIWKPKIKDQLEKVGKSVIVKKVIQVVWESGSECKRVGSHKVAGPSSANI